MDRQVTSCEQAVTSTAQNAAATVTDTNWGYIVRPGENRLIRAAYGEIVASFAAVLLGMAAYGVWLLPTANGAAELLPFRIAGTVVFVLAGGLLWLIARRGLCHEVHVDLERRVVRSARRNRRGRATPIGQIPISEVESVFLQRAKSGFLRSRLCVRTVGDQALIEVAVGAERELAPILQRMTPDLRKDHTTVAKPGRSAIPRKPRIRSAFAAR